MSNLCPVCEEGYLTEVNETETYEYLGQIGQMLSKHSNCDGCGSEVVDYPQSRYNLKECLAFKANIERITNTPKSGTYGIKPRLIDAQRNVSNKIIEEGTNKYE